MTRWFTRTARAVAGIVVAAGVLLTPTIAAAEYGFDFQRPVTEIAHDQLWLHHLIFYICVVIFVGVFGVMFYALAVHRKSRGHKAATFQESTRIEIVWTIIPFFILVVMAYP